ncbi:MAG TPA: hypothetical protein PKE29_00475 [Phycisphaerales bacterium]|nr:hypothetical protein [Phycisphaerales bacterium]
METSAHKVLRIQAVRLLVAGGCSAAGTEVRCPIARHRVDAAGYLDPLPRSGRGVAWEAAAPTHEPRFVRGERARTVIVECKQSRADFLSDSRSIDDLVAERDRLLRVRSVLEEQIIKACEPHLRISGSRLFPDLEEWNFGNSRVGSYRAVLSDLRKLDERMHGESKFWLMAHYRLADWLYIAATPGVVRPREVPPGWGLLEIDAEWGGGFEPGEHGPSGRAGVRVRAPAPQLSGKPEHRVRLLRNIAVAGTRRAWNENSGAEGAPESL